MLVTRRSFAQSVAALPLFAAPGEDKKPVIVDTHLHCLTGKDDKRFPYHVNAPYKPEKPSSPEMLLKLMYGTGVPCPRRYRRSR